MKNKNIQQPETSTLRVYQFGRFEVWRSQELISAQAWGRRKNQQLMKILLSRRGQVFSTDQLIDFMFADQEPEAALGNLRGRVGELRRVLEPDMARRTDSRYVLTLASGYCFSDQASCWVDTEQFQQELDAARQARKQADWTNAVKYAQAAVALYRGEYLAEDPYEDWLLPLRQQWRERFLEALEGEAEAHLKLGDFSAAAESSRKAIRYEPTRESAHRCLMLTLYFAGQQAEAQKAYEACAQTLQRELSVEPSAETIKLHQQLQKRELAAPASALSSPAVNSILVLPFANLTQEPETDYFSDGLTDDLIAQLARLPGVKVIARASAMRFKESLHLPQDVAKQLNVDLMLEGSVRRDAHHVRVVAKLKKTGTDEYLWVESYERPLTDLFAIQSEVAQRIALALKARLSPREQARLVRRPTHSMEAYHVYLKGRFFLNQNTEEGYHKAIQHFQKAIAMDAQYALAYAGVADAFNALAFFNFLAPKDGYLQAKEAALKALELDESLGEAHAALGEVKLFYEWTWPEAEVALRRAIELNPGYPTAHALYSRFLLYHQRFDAGLDHIRQAQELDPLSMGVNRDVGYAYYLAARYEAAHAQLQLALELFPQDRYAHFLLGLVYLEQGQFEQALAAFEAAEQSDAGGDPYLGMLIQANRGIVRARQGKRKQAQAVLAQLLKRSPQRDRASVIASLYAALEDYGQTFHWLGKAYEEKDPWLLHLNVWRATQSVRALPQFQALLGKLGWATTNEPPPRPSPT